MTFTISDLAPQLWLDFGMLWEEVEQEAHRVRRRVDSGEQHVRDEREHVLRIQLGRGLKQADQRAMATFERKNKKVGFIKSATQYQ